MNKASKIIVTIVIIVLFIVLFAVIVGVRGDAGYKTPGPLGVQRLLQDIGNRYKCPPRRDQKSLSHPIDALASRQESGS